jgi:hypothetical protein
MNFYFFITIKGFRFAAANTHSDVWRKKKANILRVLIYHLGFVSSLKILKLTA